MQTFNLSKSLKDGKNKMQFSFESNEKREKRGKNKVHFLKVCYKKYFRDSITAVFNRERFQIKNGLYWREYGKYLCCYETENISKSEFGGGNKNIRKRPRAARANSRSNNRRF